MHHVPQRHGTADVGLPPQTVVQREMRGELPVVLRVEADAMITLIRILNPTLLKRVGPAKQEIGHTQTGSVEGTAGLRTVEVDHAVAIEWPVHILKGPDPASPERELVFAFDDGEIVGELESRSGIESGI